MYAKVSLTLKVSELKIRLWRLKAATAPSPTHDGAQSPAIPAPGWTNPSGVWCFFLQISTIAGDRLWKKNSPQNPPPLYKALSQMPVLWGHLSLHYRSSGRLTAAACDTTADPPPQQGLNYPGKILQGKSPSKCCHWRDWFTLCEGRWDLLHLAVSRTSIANEGAENSKYGWILSIKYLIAC